MKVVVVVLLSVLTLSSFSSCNDAPSDVGSVLVVDTLNARSISSLDTTIFTKGESVITRGILFNTGVLYIGTTRHERAATLVRLTNIPDTLGALTTSNIDSVNILIRPLRFVKGDSSSSGNRLSFHVSELTKAFLSNDSSGNSVSIIHWPDIFTSGITPNPAYVSSDVIASFDGQIPLKDTMPDVVIPMNALGKQMIASWFAKQSDTSLKKTIYGMVFVPEATSGVIRQFATASAIDAKLPLIRYKVYYHNASSVRDSLTLQSGNDVSIVDADTVASPMMLSQSLITSEAQLTFDVSSIAPTDAILKAQLILTLDTTLIESGNYGQPGKISLITTIMKDTLKKFGTQYASGRRVGSDQVIFSNVGHALDDARRANGGKGMFSVLSTGTDLERHVFYGLSAPVEKRPKLVITYAARPKMGGTKK